MLRKKVCCVCEKLTAYPKLSTTAGTLNVRDIDGAGGFPEIDFTAGECTFCKSCVDACPTGALGPLKEEDETERRPWRIDIDVSDACMSAQGVVCRVCPEHCDAGAIRFLTPAAIGYPEIDEQKCTGCGACVAPCPTRAISIQPAG